MEQRLPDAIIIGAAKAGTGALKTFLRLNPKIVTANEEMHFFSKNYAKGYENYRRMLPFVRKDQIIIEKTPAYFRTYFVPTRIYHMNRNIRLILIVRNPVDAAISMFTHFQLIGRFPPNSTFEQSVMWTSGGIKRKVEPIMNVAYASNLQNFLRYFNLSQIHIVDGENLIKNNPAKELNLVEKFLGLEPVISEENFYFDQQKNFWCVQLKNNTNGCLHAMKGLKHVEVLESTKEKLKAFFRPLNEEFFHLINRTFEW